ncbi:MAG: hypothetical protein ISR50_11420 [Alphaproteobacteria bacterium]|nr:hypothetical protein [Alphaproteobacteria bacterium]MBL6953237.1 hypothetical protein [Alphaproteobacteria bacterium]
MTENTENPSQSDESKAHAPHSADDWEILFEAPENGLIAMIEQAHSLDALEQSTSLALTKLLVHENEQARLADYQQRLAAIVAPAEDADDVERARTEIITLLRQLKEEGKQAAEGQPETPPKPAQGKQAGKKNSGRRARHASGGQQKSTPLILGLQFAQLNKIGIIVMSALVLLVITVLAIYLRSPEMPAHERKAALAMLRAHGENAKPDASWIVEKSQYSESGKFELIFQPTRKQHISLFRSFSAMKISKFAISLCPVSGALFDKIAAYEKQIRIEIKAGGKVLTSATCPT